MHTHSQKFTLNFQHFWRCQNVEIWTILAANTSLNGRFFFLKYTVISPKFEINYELFQKLKFLTALNFLALYVITSRKIGKILRFSLLRADILNQTESDSQKTVTFHCSADTIKNCSTLQPHTSIISSVSKESSKIFFLF